MTRSAIGAALSALAALVVVSAAANAESTLDRIKQRGKLVVGVKQDYRPWGFELSLFGARVPFPAWIKAVIGLSLPVMANVSEIVRGYGKGRRSTI